MSDWALRQVAASMETDDLLVGHQDEVERRAEAIVQKELDLLRAGIAVEDVRLLFVHAPETVHYAFRDVATALEDKQRMINSAMAESNEILNLADGEAFRVRAEADIQRIRRIAESEGNAVAFRARAMEWKTTEAITKKRMYLDFVNRLLARTPFVLNLAEGVDVDIWLSKPPMAPRIAR